MKKITVIKADEFGFCMGVQKAVDIAISTRKKFPTKDVYTFGPLIHNQDVLNHLGSLGIKVLEPSEFFSQNPPDFSNAVIIIRAHGIEPTVEKALIESGADVINATCPKVIAGQLKAQKNADSYNIILAGDKNHQELIGIAGYAKLANKGDCIIVQNEVEAQNVALPDNGLDFYLIAQTTIKKSEYEKIADSLKKRIPNLEVFNSICSATKKRQDALKKLSEMVDAILVIGGKNSANTKRLFQTALQLNEHSWLIENETEIPDEVYNFSVVGVTAGASTPNFVIDKVVQTIENHF